MHKKRKPIRSVRLRRLFRLHMVVTVLSLSAYFSVAFFDPGFLSYDLRQKYHALADELVAVSATVPAPPVQPVVTGISECDDSNVLSVTLDWADDASTYTYDISRDGSPLVTGIVPSGYVDTVVASNTTYTYVVTARGPMGPGFATSDSVSVTTLTECGAVSPAPTISITSFDGRSVSSYDGIPSVSERRPTFTGTTNMPNAIIQVAVGSIDSLIAAFTANDAGYFEWKPPVPFTRGTQTFTVTAIDPDDSSRQATTSLQFKIIKPGDNDIGSKKKTVPSTVGEVTPLLFGQQAPIDFILSVENKDGAVLQGQDVQAVLKVTDVAKEYAGTRVSIRYSFVDKNGDAVFSVTKITLLQKGSEIRENLPVSLYMTVGGYSLQVEILFDQVNVSRTAKFSVAALPLLQLGGTTITYAEIIRNVGWITLVLMVSLLLWLFLFVREYWLYLHAARHITEEQLKKAGFLGKRKGVVR